MFENIYYQQLVYQEYLGKTASNTDNYGPETTIMGLRKDGHFKVTHGADGDTTICTIVYKTKEPLVEKSLINGREIISCLPVPGLGLDCGYMSYVM